VAGTLRGCAKPGAASARNCAAAMGTIYIDCHPSYGPERNRQERIVPAEPFYKGCVPLAAAQARRTMPFLGRPVGMKSWRIWSLGIGRIAIFGRASNLALVAFVLTIAMIAFNPYSGSAEQVTELDDLTFRAIADCLGEGKEYVLPARACQERRQGSRIALNHWNMPHDDESGDDSWDKVCQDKTDRRRLPANVIKRLAAERQIAPTGIRIIGAVFCGGPGSDDAALDLAGLDLNYSLAIDRSVINGNLDAHNLRIKGDFSFDNTVILDTLQLNRAHVGGSVYGSGSFMKKLSVTDTQVAGTWHQTESVIFSDAQILSAAISGDFDMTNSAFSWFLLQSGHVTGMLRLDHTQARCAYDIKASTVGYLTADHAGFRRVQTGPGAVYPWWDPSFPADPMYTMPTLSGSATVKKIYDEEVKSRDTLAKTPRRTVLPLPGCEKISQLRDPTQSQSQDLKFNVSDSRIEAVFCMTSFSWISPKEIILDDNRPLSTVELNNTRINGDLIIDLWGDAGTEVARLAPGWREYDRLSRKNKFVAIGLTAQAFIFAFPDAPYVTYLDGLKFDRIRSAQKPACESGLGGQLRPPSQDEVLNWLRKNEAPSSQPFKAFVDGFEQAGENTTDLRVRQTTFDLYAKTTRWTERGSNWLSVLNRPIALNGAPPDGQSRTNQNLIDDALDLGTIGAQWLLYLMADHGLRPGKVVIPIILVISIYWILFWKRWRIIGFETSLKHLAGSPPSTQLIHPIGLVFLFDHLIPLYRIREEHYSIGQVFRKAGPDEISGEYQMDYHGRRIALRPLGDQELRKVEKCLVLLRVIGAILSVFLLAAIHSLTS
jgi:hypothetical protein